MQSSIQLVLCPIGTLLQGSDTVSGTENAFTSGFGVDWCANGASDPTEPRSK